ncbi:MAG: ribonuclease R family protein [Bradymonadia bacterium]
MTTQHQYELERCLNILRDSTRALTLKQLARQMSWPRNEKSRLSDHLDYLVEQGKVRRIDTRHYTIAEHEKVVEGTLVCTRRGAAYLSTEVFDEDVYIPKHQLNAGMHRDRVLARLERSNGKRVASVIEVLERGTHTFVGVVHIVGKAQWIEPRDERLPDRIQLMTGSCEHGELVAARFDSYPRGRDDVPTASVIKRLAREGEAADETELMIYDLGLPTAFPRDVLEEAASSKLDVDKLLNSTHVDLRDVPFITVDPQSARDFDDAVSVQRLDTGGWCLSVAVADVSLFVSEGSRLDEEALVRGTSVYLPDRVIPMLPDHLSGDLCSLRPKVDRAAMVVQMLIDPEGNLGKATIKEAVIQSHQRLSYDAVTQYFNAADSSELPPLVRSQLDELKAVTRQLRKLRKQHGYLELELPEPKIVLDESGQVNSIDAYERQESHLMIEEAMLAANVAVAKFCINNQRETLFRVHGEPDEEKLDSFAVAFEKLGDAELSRSGVSGYSESLRRIGDPDVKALLSTLLLRSMMKAEYKTKLSLHYGLGFEAYLHFTSPIRRYPDLIVHRIVRQVLRSESHALRHDLSEVASQSNRRERLALEAERDVQALYKCLWLKDRIGERFAGFVIHVSVKGAFVKLGETHCDGFLPFERPPSRRRLNRRQPAVRVDPTGLPFQIGERVIVELEDVSVRRRRVQLKVAESDPLTEDQ